MRRCTTGIIGFFFLLLLITTNIYAAETTATVIGTVSDDKGGPLPGATVTAVNVATNISRSTTSEENGSYRIALLQPGTYNISVEVAGFAKETQTGIVLTVGKEIIKNLTLKLASATAEEIEIVGETPLIDATKSALGQTITDESIESLPLNGRDYTQLALLAPGVKAVGTLVNYGQFTIGGQRGDAVNYTIDGAENNFSYTNEARSLFTQEGIQEFQLLTNRFSAEYGRSTSGVVNVISKSGTNEFHGNAFFFFRPDSLDSQDFFSEENNVDFPVDQQQGGATLGGPIVENRTFFFAAYEQVNRDGSLSVARVPEFPTGVRPKPVDLKLFTGKVNHNLNDDQSMVFRYNFQDRAEAGFYAGGRYVHGIVQNIESQSAAVSHNAILSENSYNEALFQYGRIVREDVVEGEGPALYRPSAVTGHHYCCPQRFEENRFEFLDTYTQVFNTNKGEHTVKAGVDYIYIKPEILFAQYFGGGYFFGTDEPFDPNNPDTFPTYFFVGTGDPVNEDTNHQFSVFVQDDWRVNDRFTLNLGLRYDIESFDGPQSEVPLTTDITLGKIPPVDKNNFAPRLGFTFDVTGSGKSIMRGGYGRYYKPIFHNVYNNALMFNGEKYVVQAITDPVVLAQICCNFPDPSFYEDGAFDVRPMSNGDVAFSDQASIGLQQELASDLVISADYVYVRGQDLTRERNLNAPVNLVDPEPRPFPQYNRVRLLLTDAGSWYHALQTNLSKRFSNNLSLTASYTLSKVEEDAADFFSVSEPSNQADLGAEKGPGTHDQRHVFAFGGVYDMQMGIQLGGIVRASSAIPVNFIMDRNHNSDGFCCNDRPDLGPGDTFAIPPADRPGNMPRNFGRGTDFFQVDLRVGYNFGWDPFKLELLFETFNLFNRTNFNFRPVTVSRTVGDDDVGTPVEGFAEATEVFEPRQLQFGIKFNW